MIASLPSQADTQYSEGERKIAQLEIKNRNVVEIQLLKYSLCNIESR